MADIIVLDSKSFENLLKLVEGLHAKCDAILAGHSSTGVLDGREVCKALKITPRTLQRYRDSGVIEFTQIGRKVLYPSKSIEKFMSEHHIKRRS